MPATNHIPGPAPQQEQQVPRLLTQTQESKLFWNNPVTKVYFNKATNDVTKLHKCKERLLFLKTCLQNDVVPVTLKIKSNAQVNYSANGQFQVNSVTHDASLKLLKIAIKDAESLIPDLQNGSLASLRNFKLQTSSEAIRKEIDFQVDCTKNRIIQ